MALQNLLPSFLAKVDEKGRPRWALTITAITATVLTYMSLSANGLKVLNWLIAITRASIFTNWAIITITPRRFHFAIKAQNSTVLSRPYG
ncbi:hypothetical protein BO94DRAFT_626915 [Aspergillus sclerotioniger CBS 115572]|uniref:Amino acid permease/ SLC12A domain-containing protein n=1 Tax=Aspergillus sclerotioniger CBS 115572 TaxID=1450535 RepID=A0A317VSL8_9EURO|nr:hypothetical protein BO94DRAFT_626915 [Aspergillus sclerotioniger CBS 115572]PWY77323.1 hypothetical protein BO94DRAFT_626915 [Aspergillus sclerotioniger CBS 115572]